MRALAIALSIAPLGLPLGAAAQPDQVPSQNILRVPPAYGNLTPEDKQTYCFWAGQIYSLGASFCSRQQSSLTCTEWPGKRPIWVVKDNDKACDKNPSLTPL
jgi:hypothetical protein